MSEYSLEAYGAMIADRTRVDAYSAALRRALAPGAVVLDIGTGSGYFALLAARLGARHVYAIEPSEIIQVARDCAAASGLADRISFHQGLSTDIALPERADVIVSDLRGVLPLHGRHLAAIADARARHLAPGGTLIAARDTVHGAIATIPEVYRTLMAPWDGSAAGLDLGPARQAIANSWRRVSLAAEDLRTAPAPLFELDYRRALAERHAGELRWTIDAPGEGDGLAIWFASDLADGIRMTSAPGAPPLVYGQAYFPWPSPLDLAAGDVVTCRVAADPNGEGYAWRWATDVVDAQGTPRAAFRQSTLYSLPLSLESLHRRAAGARPALGAQGRELAAALALMDGATPLRAIAGTLADRWPERFPTAGHALDFVAEISARYAE